MYVLTHIARFAVVQKSATKFTPRGVLIFPSLIWKWKGGIVEGTSGIQYLLYARMGYQGVLIPSPSLSSRGGVLGG